MFRQRVGPFVSPCSASQESLKVNWSGMLLRLRAILNPVTSNGKAAGAELAYRGRARVFCRQEAWGGGRVGVFCSESRVRVSVKLVLLRPTGTSLAGGSRLNKLEPLW